MDINYFIGRSVCHQLAERSFVFDGYILPVCARCTGIYLSIFLTFTFLAIKKRLNGGKPISLFSVVFFAVCLLPLMFDGVSSYLGLRASSQLLRLLTGSTFGYSLPVLITLASNVKTDDDNNQTIIKNTETLIIFAVSMLVAAVVYLGLLPGIIIGCTSVTGIFIMFFLTAKMLVKLIFNKWSGAQINIAACISALLVIVVFSNVNSLLRQLVPFDI